MGYVAIYTFTNILFLSFFRLLFPIPSLVFIRVLVYLVFGPGVGSSFAYIMPAGESTARQIKKKQRRMYDKEKRLENHFRSICQITHRK